ncbi:MAG: hypothetical protein ACRBN8_14000 [Nannocystales bacterium]
MKRSFLMMMLAAATLTGLASCNPADNSTGVAQPFRGEWETVIDQPFNIYAEDGTIEIQTVRIGDDGGDNFNNRGDVIVQYADVSRITVEMRKFTQVESQALAEEDFAKLSIWGSTATLPARPFTLDPEDNCVDPTGVQPWQDDCQIAVFYDGQVQVDRSGADLRVTLPRDFIFDLQISTDDNLADSDYQNRGNVCVENLPGSADITLSNGTAWVIVDENSSISPLCAAADVETCEAAGWASDCPCLAADLEFGQVKITSNDGQAADGIVDIPSASDFWVGYLLRNDGDNTPGNDEDGALCEARVDDSAGQVRLAEGIDLGQKPNENQGSINFPGDMATEGAGYNISMNSAECLVILATEDPNDFAGVGNGPTQDRAERGNLTICSGCARAVGCDDLVPGL